MRPIDKISTIAASDPYSKLIGFSDGDLRARPFKLLRTTLSRQLSECDSNLIGITSASPDAGKTFIAANLAASMSRISSGTVILVDLDLQRASIASMFGLDEPPGVTEYLLSETNDVSDIARRIEDTNLIIVPSLPRSINSAELIAGERLPLLLSNLRALSEETTIICDLPPLFVSDDAMLAAQHLDGVIMVIEQGVTTKKQLEASLQLLYPIKLIGTIFNHFAGSFGDPYGYYGSYGSYYK